MFPPTAIILYAEDNENDFVLLKYALAQANVPAELLFVSSGQAAVDFLRTRPPPDIVLLDLRLPGISGLDVLEWIRRRDSTFSQEMKDYLFTDKPIAHK